MFMYIARFNYYQGFAYESDLAIFAESTRLAFQIVLWPIVIVGLVGNAAVFCRIIVAPSGKFSMLKPFYRCALLSFATSDLMLLIASGSNSLTVVIFKTGLLWKLPNWTCSAIPYFQTVAVFSGSLTLAGIAVDRYRALTAKCPTNEGHPWCRALFFNILIWLVALAASYPVLGMYNINTLYVITPNATVYEGSFCMTNQNHAALVYTALFVTIFIPLAVIFVTVHVLLALNIWRRQEQSNKSQLPSGNDSQSTEFSTVSSQVVRRPNKAPPQRFISNHICRKKRTVNVILVLILTFLLGRIPIWIFLLFKLHTKLEGTMWIHLQVILSGLTFLNATVDPFLYTFLCEALSLLTFLQSCRKKKKKKKEETHQITPNETDNHKVNPTIVPRGPYNNQ